MRFPTEFKLVKQPPKSKLCGAAVCAMALCKTLEEVMEEIDWRELSHTGGIAKYLGRYHISLGWWAHWQQSHTNESFLNEKFKITVSPKDRPAILAVTSAVFDDADHWVFWDGRKILDPSVEQEKYTVLEIHFLTYWPDIDLEGERGDWFHSYQSKE